MTHNFKPVVDRAEALALLKPSRRSELRKLALRAGYASARKTETAQFTLADARSPAEVFAAIRANGQEAVFKTWDNRI